MPKKYRVEITQKAEKDIEEIWDYIAQDNIEKATQFIQELDRQAQTLERFPLRCPLIPENQILGQSYRHLIYGDYRTIFRIDQNIVYVMRVIHGSRLLELS